MLVPLEPPSRRPFRTLQATPLFLAPRGGSRHADTRSSDSRDAQRRTPSYKSRWIHCLHSPELPPLLAGAFLRAPPSCESDTGGPQSESLHERGDVVVGWAVERKREMRSCSSESQPLPSPLQLRFKKAAVRERTTVAVPTRRAKMATRSSVERATNSLAEHTPRTAHAASSLRPSRSRRVTSSCK